MSAKRSMPPHLERRAFAADQFRVEGEGERRIVGHAAVFNVTVDLGWFRERILPGAFAESISRDDIRALFNHDANLVLGRNRSKTLKLAEDERGLAVEILPPDTQNARDLLTSIGRGDISQMSFAFETLDADWSTEDGMDVRTLKRAKLWDVSPVTYPAYPQTDAALRSHEAWQKQRQESQAALAGMLAERARRVRIVTLGL